MGDRRTLSRITKKFLFKEIAYELRMNKKERERKKSSGIKFRERTFQERK